MATQICPKCNLDSFVWSCEDDTPLTQWGCECGYIAFEDESKERKCIRCRKKTESHLKDNQKEYWWCSNCNKIEIITPPSPLLD